MLALYVVALACWASVSHSAPVSCENLLRPMDQLDFDYLKGTWALVAATVSNETHMETLKTRDSASISFANNSDTSDITFTRVFSADDSCQYMESKIVLNVSSFSYPKLNVTTTLFSTSCPDCLAMHYGKSDRPARFYLFSRRREVKPEELQEFKDQVECLKLPEPVVMDPTKELCPEKTSPEAADQTA